MTEHHINVVRIGAIEKHPNADSLSITQVHGGYPVIFKTGEYNTGDLAVYVPVDSIVPNTPEWQWLASSGAELRDKDRRIKAKRLRKVFSMGLLADAPPGAKEGQDVAQQMGITRYDPDAEIERKAPALRAPKTYPWWKKLWWWVRIWFGVLPPGWTIPTKPPSLKHAPGVYDIEPFRAHGRRWFNQGEYVVVTEKIHGQNASFVSVNGKLHVKSRTQWRRNDPKEHQNIWARVAAKYDLERKLKDRPGLVLFGETYGNNADMPYGVDREKDGDAFMAFDVYDSNEGRWFDYGEFRMFCQSIQVPTVPELVLEHWDEEHSYGELMEFAEGKSTVRGANHIREGFVVKPIKERIINGGQRVILKMAGESYLTRKSA